VKCTSLLVRVITEDGIKVSMDGKGRWVDHVLIERLWRSVRYEDVYLKEYPSVLALRHGVVVYFHFYNNERPKKAFLLKKTTRHA
jgi:putative transposase